MRSVLLTILLIYTQCAENVESISTVDNVTKTEKLIRNAGFEPNFYYVTTKDGYILRVTQICSKIRFGPPVLLVHDLFGSADSWIQRGRKESLAFILADHGYDVFLADLRGNEYSNKHQNLTIENDPEQFYNYSFHEIGLYDLRAIIGHVLKCTPYLRIFYIGYSMSTTAYFVLTTIDFEFNDCIRQGIMLSPVVFGSARFTSKLMTEFQNGTLQNILTKSKIYNIDPKNPAIKKLICSSCSNLGSVENFDIVEDFLLVNASQAKKDEIRVYLSAINSGASVKNLVHFSQMFKTADFAEFDYGKEKNKQLYDDKLPREYLMNDAHGPVVLLSGSNDHFSDHLAVERLSDELARVSYREEIQNYDHLDFLYAKDAPQVLYRKIVDILRNNAMNPD